MGRLAHFSHNIYVEGLLFSCPWACRGSLLESSFSDPSVPPGRRCCYCCCYYCCTLDVVPCYCCTLNAFSERRFSLHSNIWPHTLTCYCCTCYCCTLFIVHFCCSKSHFPYKMTITLPRMYLFKIWQMQKIEQVMPEVTVILQELETFKIFSKRRCTAKFACDLGFAGCLPLNFLTFLGSAKFKR